MGRRNRLLPIALGGFALVALAAGATILLVSSGDPAAPPQDRGAGPGAPGSMPAAAIAPPPTGLASVAPPAAALAPPGAALPGLTPFGLVPPNVAPPGLAPAGSLPPGLAPPTPPPPGFVPQALPPPGPPAPSGPLASAGFALNPLPPPPLGQPPLLTEAEILALPPTTPTLVRLRENPRVFILHFPSLAAQGAALNRVAALVEKAGFPRDRVVTEVELAAALRRTNENADTFLYGHDYRATDLLRFFALTDRDSLTLNPSESWVRAQTERMAALAGPGPTAMVSIAAEGPPSYDRMMRQAILRHEISHGHYFTVLGFAEHVNRVWRERFTAPQRAAMRRFLASEGYDQTDEALMANETMAYLLFTPDRRFFSAELARLSEADVERMRAALRDGLPTP